MRWSIFLAAALLAAPVAAQTFAPGNPVTEGNPLPVKNSAAVRGGSTPTAGTIANAVAYQSVLAASTTRKGCAIHNKSGAIMRVFLGAPAAATDALSFDLPAGGIFSCAAGSLVLTDEISLASATQGAAYLVVRQ